MKTSKLFYVLLIITFLTGCYGANSETSEIGSLNPKCLDSIAWDKICAEHSIDSIKDLNLISKLEDIKNHFIKPDYILYFKNKPIEIIGCDWYSIRVVYNENIADETVTGTSPLLGNKEQKRIRNRVLNELKNYQCEEGQVETNKKLESAVPFANSHKNYPKKRRVEMMEPDFEKEIKTIEGK